MDEVKLFNGIFSLKGFPAQCNAIESRSFAALSAATLARLEPSHFLAMNHQLATGIAALKLVGPRQPHFAIRLFKQRPFSLIVVGAMVPVANWRTGLAAYGI